MPIYTKSITTVFIKDESEEKNREIEFVMTNQNKDRDNDIIHTSGIDIEDFLKNPVVLLNHSRDQPIARVKEIKRSDHEMIGVVEFPEEGISVLADETFGLIKAGVLNASSIGFVPSEDGMVFNESIRGFEDKRVKSKRELEILKIKES